jgi:hypothetical protein
MAEGDPDLLSVLLERGANPFLKDKVRSSLAWISSSFHSLTKEGRSPRDHARRLNLHDFEMILRRVRPQDYFFP